MTHRKTFLAALAVILSMATVALAANPTVTYTAQGSFGSVISGMDSFRLANEPFIINVVANDAQLTKTHGPTYADYGPLQLTGQVSSQLMPTPIIISNHATFLLMTNGGYYNYDLFEIATKVNILAISLNITAVIHLPKGTLTSIRNHPFGPVALTPDMATMTYSDGTNSTTLGINGTLVGVTNGARPLQQLAAAPIF